MRTAFAIGRLCLRQKPQRFIATLARHERQYSIASKWRIPFRPPPKPPKGRVVVWSLLSPATFVALSEEQTGDGKTPEMHMLEASRAEIAKEIPNELHGFARIWRGLYLFMDTLIVEPIATMFRFLHLVVIFVPVIGTIPLVWLGGRRKDRDNERSGTLWWYSFLVHSMERAGPAFIKVENITPARDTLRLISIHSSASRQHRDQTYSLKKCATPCLPCTPTLPPTP